MNAPFFNESIYLPLLVAPSGKMSKGGKVVVFASIPLFLIASKTYYLELELFLTTNIDYAA